MIIITQKTIQKQTFCHCEEAGTPADAAIFNT